MKIVHKMNLIPNVIQTLKTEQVEAGMLQNPGLTLTHSSKNILDLWWFRPDGCPYAAHPAFKPCTLTQTTARVIVGQSENKCNACIVGDHRRPASANMEQLCCLLSESHETLRFIPILYAQCTLPFRSRACCTCSISL